MWVSHGDQAKTSTIVEVKSTRHNAFMSHQIHVEVSADHVATVEFERGPRNHFDAALIAELADTFERLDADPDARAIVLCSSLIHRAVITSTLKLPTMNLGESYLPR